MPDFALPSASALIASIIFGTIGLAAFGYGKKNAAWQTMCLGLALMVFPYFIEQTWLLYVVGIALCVGLYFFRE